MRVLFFGTPDFAVPTLRALIESCHTVCGVVCQPDRRRGRGRRTSPAPVAELALAEGLPLFRPEKVGAADSVATLHETAPEIGVVVAFGQFLTKRVRELPSCGYLINGHASLLPKYRGAAPIVHAILDGEVETGVSVMRVEREMDAGPVLLTERTEIRPDDTAETLTGRVATLTAHAIVAGLEAIENGLATFVPQDHSRATAAPKITREDAELDFSEPARALECRVRAMSPSPGAYCEGPDGPLRILAARASDDTVDCPPGTVRSSPDVPIAVATASGWLLPDILQRPGGKALAVDAFLRGHPISDGVRLNPVGSAARLSQRSSREADASGGS